MRSVEMKNRCLLYYGNPVGYRTEQGVVADSMFRREELEDWLARKGLAVRWEDGIYDPVSPAVDTRRQQTTGMPRNPAVSGSSAPQLPPPCASLGWTA